MRVELEIPEALRGELVYRLTCERGHKADVHPEDSFIWFDSAALGCKHFELLMRTFGAIAAIRCVLKLLSRRRMLYGIAGESGLVHYGWVTCSKCRYYSIESTSAVIGPVWTSEAHRGQGLATGGLRFAILQLSELHVEVVYINTSIQNTAMQRVIVKCGFGLPVASFLRAGKWAESL